MKSAPTMRWSLGLALVAISQMASADVRPPTTDISGVFYQLSANGIGFMPSTATLPGWPTVTYTDSQGAHTVLQNGWQQGDLLADNRTLYYPYATQTGGGFIDQPSEIPHGIVLSFAGRGSAFGDSSHWSYFDLTTLPISQPPGVTDSPVFYVGGVIVGNIDYFVPGGATNFNPVFIAYDTSKQITDRSAYKLYPAPARGTTLGNYYGWDTGVTDGRYVYYTPSSDGATPQHGGLGHGNFVRYDTSKPFAGASSWSSFDMTANINLPACLNALTACVAGFQGSVYDGYRYIYLVPLAGVEIVRYDTWNGGSRPDPSGFTNPKAGTYTIFDPTKLGTSGYPSVTGYGQTSNLWGWTGGVVAWDSDGQNEYLYLIPWETFPNGQTHQGILQSTVARVRIGMKSGASWIPVDFTNPAASPHWEIMDLTQFTQSRYGWPPGWETTFTPEENSAFPNQSRFAGFQLGWFNPSTQLVSLSPDVSRYIAQHDINFHLWDPTGWEIGPTPDIYYIGPMGGAFDASQNIYYPSPVKNPLAQIGGLGTGLGIGKPVITSPMTANGIFGQAFQYQITATHSPTHYNADGLPAGLAVNAISGLIFGTPTALGNVHVNLTATNSSGSGANLLQITLSSAPDTTPPNAPAVLLATAVSSTQVNTFWNPVTDPLVPGQITSGVAGYELFRNGVFISSITTGNTYVDLGLVPSTTYTYVVKTYDAALNISRPSTPVKVITLPRSSPVITSALTAQGFVDQSFVYQIAATNSPTSFSASALPAGLSVDTASGLISGTCQSVATFSVTIAAANAAGAGHATLLLTILRPPPVTVAVNPSAIQLSDAQSHHFVATVTGTADTTVTWTLKPTVGSLSVNGLYTAPATIHTIQEITITATSVADPTKSANAMVTLGSGAPTTSSEPGSSASALNPRVFPNPWRADKHNGLDIVFDHLPPQSSVKIFNLAGHVLKVLHVPASGAVNWNRTDDSGKTAASGIYLYVAIDDQGNKMSGQFSLAK